MVLILAVVATCQQTLVVGSGGAFTDIQSAINAAVPGDTVLVQGGTHSALLNVDKGIALVGQNAILSGGLFQETTVANVPAGQVFSMSGFQADASGTDVLIDVVDCDGIVAIANLSQGGLQQWWIKATNAAQFHLTGSIVRSVNLLESNSVVTSTNFDPVLFHGLRIEGGRTAIVRCTIRGGNGTFPGPAILLMSGVLALSRGSASATGFSVFSHPAISTSGGAVLLDPSTALSSTGGQPLIGGPATVVPFPFASVTAASNGTTLTTEMHGLAGHGFAVFAGLPAAQLDTPLGLLWLDPNNYALLELGIVPASRLVQSSFTQPPTLLGFPLAVQAIEFGVGSMKLSSPTLVVSP